jgi:FSR family fosmidomycin resistance protein-like MFS transporter
MLGHLCTDINQGALPAVLPFLVLRHNLSYMAAASLILAANLVSSVIQPYFGYLGDKYSRPWLMSLGVMLAGSGIALIGFGQSYGAIFAAAALSGLGIALFHPEGGKIANFVAGDKKGTGLGVFIIGGNLGFTLGPVIATGALVLWGLQGTIVFLIPAVVMAGILLPFTSGFREVSLAAKNAKTIKTEPSQTDDWSAFSKVAFAISCRSILHYAFLAFIPLYFISVFLQSEAEANTNLIVFSLASAVATLAGGSISDRIGFRRITRITFFAMAPLIFIMLQTGNSLFATFLVALIGIAMNSTAGTLIAMGQAFIPNRIGLASGITLGLAISVGGVFAPFIGLVGDSFGIMAAMYTICH